MKILYFFLFLSPISIFAQEYVDLLKISYGQSFNNEFEGTSESTSVKSFDADLTFPVVLNEKNAFITGGFYSRNNLQLFPNGPFTSLHSTTLKLGVATTYNDTWSSTVVFLPKFSSDYVNSTEDDLYYGGVILVSYQKKERLKYRFGVFGTGQAFGFFTTPIIGLYYLSPDSKFEIDASIPVSADINYTFGITTLGVDYIGIGRSFRITENDSGVYADVASLDFSSYLQFNALEKSVLLRAKFGYSANTFEVYQDGDTIDLGLTSLTFGDDRTQLNPNINNGFFLKFEAIYRFDISEDSPVPPVSPVLDKQD